MGPDKRLRKEINRPALQIGSALRFNEDLVDAKGVDLSRPMTFWDHVNSFP